MFTAQREPDALFRSVSDRPLIAGLGGKTIFFIEFVI